MIVKRGWLALTVTAIMVAMVSAFPLSWGLAAAASSGILRQTITLGPISGSIWRGQIRHVKTSIGKINHIGFRFSPRNLLANHPYLIDFNGPGYQGRAELGLNAITGANLRANIQHLVVDDPRFVGVRGVFKLQDLSVLVKQQQCLTAKGYVQTDFLSQNERVWQWIGPELEGEIECENGILMAHLHGANQTVKISSKIQVKADGWYQADITVFILDKEALPKPAQDPALPATKFYSTAQSLPLLLPLLGFVSLPNQDNGYFLREQGNFIRG